MTLSFYIRLVCSAQQLWYHLNSKRKSTLTPSRSRQSLMYSTNKPLTRSYSLSFIRLNQSFQSYAPNPALSLFSHQLTDRLETSDIGERDTSSRAARLDHASLWCVLILLYRLCLICVNAGESYVLSIPNLGSFTSQLHKGRDNLIKTIQRKRYKYMREPRTFLAPLLLCLCCREALQSELEAKKLKKTKLPLEYHLLDLLGLQQISRVHTTSGPLIRVKAVSK